VSRRRQPVALGGIDQTAAMIVQKQSFQHPHRAMKQRNGQRGQHTDQGGNQQATKHDLNIRIIMKTMHHRLRH
jgi:hypothetical protein